MAFTARLPEVLEREAKLYAEGVGLSLNALLAVSLRDYLDGRRSAPRAAVEPSVPVLQAPKRPRDACHCGSRQQWRHCHGKPK